MITLDHTMWWIIWPLLGFWMWGGRSGWWGGRNRDRWGGRRQEFDTEPLLKELDAQKLQIDEMSARLAELENRADFTERMLASPKEALSHKP
ncbi:MAG: hypothetical protein ABJC74_17815 [Gemmatimonadota bacterium]